MMNFEILFWLSLGVLAYTYIGYPLLMWLWSRFRRPHRKLDIEPGVTLLLILRNEGRHVRERIENLLALDYPADRREIVVACDGCTDDTAALARRYEDSGVRVLEFARRCGRAALLNALVPTLRGDVVVLMGARQATEPQALRALVAHFADPRTGAVSGALVPEGGGAAGVGEEYEDFLRANEGRVHSTVCTTVALFALRRRLFFPLPARTLIEDALISENLVKRGFRVHYEPGARAHERGEGGGELAPRMHRPSDVLQLLRRECGCLNPFSNPLWLQTLSHRFLRLLGPFCLLAAFAANLFLLEDPGYRVLFALQVLFYGAALAGGRQQGGRTGLYNLPRAICQLNWALVKKLLRLLFGRQELAWKKAEG